MKQPQKILVIKASGEQELFDPDKLKGSLQRAGAREQVIKEILADILDWAYDGVTTQKIYQRAFSLLKNKRERSAVRYKLKKAILEFGPSGYPFEHFIGILFKRMGYSVEVGQVLQGNCVTHEMDVIATGHGKQILVECKYSQDQGKHQGVQVPLYVRSRVDDIIRKRMTMSEYEGLQFEGWVVTNTRFSPDATQFGKCSGLKLLGWDYPAGHGLKDLIEREDIHPITLLHLTQKEKKLLLEQDIVTCAGLKRNLQALDALELSERKYKAVMGELEEL